MINIIILFCYFLFSGCAISQNRNNLSDIELLLNVWQNKSSKEEIITKYGIVDNEKKINNKILLEYYFKNSTIPKTIFFISEELKLEGILYLADEQDKSNFLSKISCPWKKSTKTNQRADIIRELEFYSCPQRDVNIHSSEHLNGFYEVWFGNQSRMHL